MKDTLTTYSVPYGWNKPNVGATNSSGFSAFVCGVKGVVGL